MNDYKIIPLAHTDDIYINTDVPGEFRRFTDKLGANQLAISLIHIPPHSDFEQGTGHFHDEIEELYIITSGTLTMRFGDDIKKVSAPAVVRVSPDTPRSHRNEGSQAVDMWAVSHKVEQDDSTLIKEFWEASPEAKQRREK